MTSQAPFKVLIVGGGIGGLALAIMLEKNNIDFELFEAYPEIAPAAGSGIGLQPNGLRVLDQLGCYDEIMKRAERATEQTHYRGPDGAILYTQCDLNKDMIERHAYPLIFIDRQVLLEVLYGELRDQSKVHTGMKVVNIVQTEDDATITTVDGSSYTGDIVIGADGVHSVVRQEMRRHAGEKGAGDEYQDDDDMPATYACMFGLSSTVPNLPRGELHFIHNEGFSYIIGTGPENRTYWFLAHNMGQTFRGRDIPKFDEKDGEKLVQQHLNDPITPEVSFADLYKHNIRAVYGPLQEMAHAKWHFGRLATVGDASHKFLTGIAQGGSAAIESAACLTNCLVEALRSETSATSPSLKTVTSVFEKTQTIRMPRVNSFVEASHGVQRCHAFETPEIKAATLEGLSKKKHPDQYSVWAQIFLASVSLNMLTDPVRSITCPYEDEVSRRGSTTAVNS